MIIWPFVTGGRNNDTALRVGRLSTVGNEIELGLNAVMYCESVMCCINHFPVSIAFPAL